MCSIIILFELHYSSIQIDSKESLGHLWLKFDQGFIIWYSEKSMNFFFITTGGSKSVTCHKYIIRHDSNKNISLKLYHINNTNIQLDYQALTIISVPNPLLGFSDTLKTFWTTKRLKKKIRKGIMKDFYFSSIMYSRADINIIWFVFETHDIIL